MELKKISIVAFILLTGCAIDQQGITPEKQDVRDFCIETVCGSLENSGEHYQRKQQDLVRKNI